MKKSSIIVLFALLSVACSVNKITLTPENSKRGDAVFSLIVPDNNYGKLEDIHIYSWRQGGVLNVNRVLIDFDLTPVASAAAIDSAFLNLYFNTVSAYNKVGGNKGNQGPDSIVIQRVISEWEEDQVTWNEQPATSTEHQVIIPKLEAANADYIHIDVTDLIRDISSDQNNCQCGLMVKHKNEIPYNVVFFASADHPNKKLHPELTVYYRKR